MPGFIEVISAGYSFTMHKEAWIEGVIKNKDIMKKRIKIEREEYFLVIIYIHNLIIHSSVDIECRLQMQFLILQMRYKECEQQ